jgi:ankyrin repeat protein
MNEYFNSQKHTDSVDSMYHDLSTIFTGDEINYQDWYQRLSQKRIFDEVVNRSYDGWTLLHYVASDTKLEDTQLCKIAKWLFQSGANIDVLNEEGVTPLIMAAENGHKKLVKFLVKCSANVNFELRNSVKLYSNVLREAIVSKQVDIVNYLVKKGATPFLTGHTDNFEILDKLYLLSPNAAKQAAANFSTKSAGWIPLVKSDQRASDNVVKCAKFLQRQMR